MLKSWKEKEKQEKERIKKKNDREKAVGEGRWLNSNSMADIHLRWAELHKVLCR